MSTEFYAILGVGISLASLVIGLSGMTLYLINQTNRRIDRLEDQFTSRMDRLEDKIDNLQTQAHGIDIRLAKLEWLVGADSRQRPELPPDAEAS